MVGHKNLSLSSDTMLLIQVIKITIVDKKKVNNYFMLSIK